MIPIWLVRHGEAAASWGEHPDPGLSELGRSQAQAAAEELIKHLPVDVALVSSPKARALETAEPLADKLGKPVAVVSAFQEIQSPVPLNERQSWLRGFMRQQWHEQPQTIWQWREDIISTMLQLDQPTVVFTHFLVINAVIAHISKQPETLQYWPDNASSHAFARHDDSLQVINLGREMSTRVN